MREWKGRYRVDRNIFQCVYFDNKVGKRTLKSLHLLQVVSPMDGGPDIEVWQRAGVPTASLYNENEKYFWFHHSDGDTMSVEDPDTLDKCLALWTSVAYVAADITHKIPQTEVQQEGPRVTTTAP
ncbi:carboxypeptidase Q-like [Penaeus monodon]|uniref:carboxypeptidase Q-like n=1 Tax=Penaeus monodon TaxID=6687 RepID=UPI0018A7DCA1|nr:carboxypeptidase Q-like [Penaeus monodon]